MYDLSVSLESEETYVRRECFLATQRSLSECEATLEKTKVSLRSWFPILQILNSGWLAVPLDSAFTQSVRHRLQRLYASTGISALSDVGSFTDRVSSVSSPSSRPSFASLAPEKQLKDRDHIVRLFAKAL